MFTMFLFYVCCNSPEFQYSCGRTSQIWRVSSNAMRATASQRVTHLSRHKTAPPDYLEHRPQFAYSCGRSSQIWTTSKAAMSCRPRPHTASLARPKQTHPDYHPSRQVYMLDWVGGASSSGAATKGLRTDWILNLVGYIAIASILYIQWPHLNMPHAAI